MTGGNGPLPPQTPDSSPSDLTSKPSSGFVQRNQGPLIIGVAIIIAALVVAFLFRGGGSAGRDQAEAASKASPKTYSLKADFTITGDYSSVYFESLNGRLGETCEGDGGYSDISPGVGVSVTDRTGTLLAASTLESGTVTDKFADEVECTLTFTVDDLPESDAYTVEVADRGELTYTKAELQEADWQVFLSL
jgi:hypothetical protein